MIRGKRFGYNRGAHSTQLAPGLDDHARLEALQTEVQDIENQLRDPNRKFSFPSAHEYGFWRSKAQSALVVKMKQINEIQREKTSKGEALPDEDSTAAPVDIRLSSHRMGQQDFRPDPDKVIETLCNAVMQTRSLKKRLYNFYKIAAAAADLVKANGEDPDGAIMGELAHWLDRAGYDVGYQGEAETQDVFQTVEENHESDYDPALEDPEENESEA